MIWKLPHKVLGIFMALLVGGAAVLGVSRAVAAEEVVFCTDPTYRPLAFYDEDQNLVGFDIDLSKAMAEHMSVDLAIDTMAFDGLIPALQAGRCDIEPEMSVREKRKEQVDFSIPFFSQSDVVVVPIDEEGFDPKTPADLKGKKVGVTSGTAADLIASQYPGVDIVRYNTTPDSFRDLVLARIDAVSVDSLTAGYLVKHTYPDKLRVSSQPLSDRRVDIASAVKKGNTDLLNRLNKAVEAMKADGSLDAIVKKWFGDIDY